MAVRISSGTYLTRCLFLPRVWLLPPEDSILLSEDIHPQEIFSGNLPYLFITPRIKLPSGFHTKHALKTLTHHF